MDIARERQRWARRLRWDTDHRLVFAASGLWARKYILADEGAEARLYSALRRERVYTYAWWGGYLVLVLIAAQVLPLEVVEQRWSPLVVTLPWVIGMALVGRLTTGRALSALPQLVDERPWRVKLDESVAAMTADGLWTCAIVLYGGAMLFGFLLLRGWQRWYVVVGLVLGGGGALASIAAWRRQRRG